MNVEYLSRDVNLFDEAFHEQSKTQIKCAKGVGPVAYFVMIRSLWRQTRYLHHIMPFENENAHRDEPDGQRTC